MATGRYAATRGSGLHEKIWKRAPSTVPAISGGLADLANPRSPVYALYVHWCANNIKGEVCNNCSMACFAGR